MNSVQVESVQVEGVGTCIAAVDFVSGVCNKSRRDAQNTVTGILNSKNNEDAKKILCRKATVPGFQQPTYVVTYDECLDLIYFLPRQRVQHMLDFINKQFKRVRAGDASLHAELEARAADDGLEARMARESLGLERALVQEDAEERALKRRKITADVSLVEAQAKQLEMTRIEAQFNLLSKLGGGEVQARDVLMLQDCVRNLATSGAALLLENGPGSGQGRVITISERCRQRGLTFRTEADWKSIGTIAGNMYFKREKERTGTGKRPPKHVQEAVGGNVRDVNTYMAPDDLPLIDAAIDAHVSKLAAMQAAT